MLGIDEDCVTSLVVSSRGRIPDVRGRGGKASHLIRRSLRRKADRLRSEIETKTILWTQSGCREAYPLRSHLNVKHTSVASACVGVCVWILIETRKKATSGAKTITKPNLRAFSGLGQFSSYGRGVKGSH
jgi:hypothetical protein